MKVFIKTLLLISSVYIFFSQANELISKDSSSQSTLIEIDQTLEFLLMSEGEPSEVIVALSDGEPFYSYYYMKQDVTYIINKETGYICAVTYGKHTGSCDPTYQ